MADSKKGKAGNGEDEGKSDKPKKSKKYYVLLAVAVILSLTAGGFAYYLLNAYAPKKPPAVKKVRKPAGPLAFQALEPFVVNLAASEHMLQVATTLKLMDAKTAEEIKANMPELRHRVILLLSRKTAEDLATVEARERLAGMIRDEANAVLGVASASQTSATNSTSGSQSVSTVTTGSVPKTTSDTSATIESASDETAPVISAFFTSFIIQ